MTMTLFDDHRYYSPSFFWEERFESSGYTPVAGVDEAGRGPLAGPVVAAAAIILDRRWVTDFNITDSKKLTPVEREKLFQEIVGSGKILVGIGAASNREIDKLNILNATFLAMRRAIGSLPVKPSAVIVDGNREIPQLEIPQKPLVKGDLLSYSVAAASIVAKVVRDRIMKKLALFYPEYGWERNMGYPTREHKEVIKTMGFTPHHRRSFRV